MRATKQRQLNGRMDGAFTSTDLITVFAVLLIFGAIQWPSMANTKGKGQSTSCLSNHRQLVRAWQQYADDHGGRLAGNLDGGAVPVPRDRTWVLGWLDFSGLPDNTNTLFLTVYSPLAPYLHRAADVFKCPVDTSLSFGNRGLPRVRSVAMNSFMGDDERRNVTTGYHRFRNISQIVKPKPSQAFVFIDEREDSINDGCFWVDVRGFDPPAPNEYAIMDYPADWHNRGANLSFVDGHTETWRWRDPRTISRHWLPPNNQPSPNNPDVRRIQEAATSKVN